MFARIRIGMFLTLLAIVPAGYEVLAQVAVVTQSVHLRADASN